MAQLYALKVNNLFYDVEYFTSLPSTSTYLKNKKELREGMVAIAYTQTKGRGRDGNKFYSPRGGLYFSFVLQPKDEIINYITPLCGVAVKEAIGQISGEDTKIKWVNDIYNGDKKCCGILAETKVINGETFVIIGIGINTVKPLLGFNRKIKDIATTACLNMPNENLNTQILNIIEKYYKRFNKQMILEKYRKYTNVIGKKVEIISTKEIAKAVDIDDEFRLVVENDKGERLTLNSGEIKFVG